MFKNGFTTGINKWQIRSSLIFNIDELFNERRKYIQDVKEGKDVLNREIPPLYTREFLYYLVWKYFSYPGYESYSTVLWEWHEIRTAILERIKNKM